MASGGKNCANHLFAEARKIKMLIIKTMKKFKLISLIDLVMLIDQMTTKEFCDAYHIPYPNFVGGVDDLLRIDANKHKVFIDYAKFLKKPLKLDMFYPLNEKGEVMFYDSLNFENANKFKEAESKLLFNGFSFILSYQSPMMKIHFNDILVVWWWDRITQTWSLSKGLNQINDLVDLGLEINSKSIASYY